MATPDKGKQGAKRIPSQIECNKMRAHAQKSLDEWNGKEARYKDASSAPPLNTVPCEVMLGLLDELARLQEVEARMKGLEK